MSSGNNRLNRPSKKKQRYVSYDGQTLWDTRNPGETPLFSRADWMSTKLKRLAPAEVAVPRRFSLCTLPEKQFPHRCFPMAVSYVEMHRIKGMYYVLGEAVCGGLGQHGWVELPGNIIFDGAVQRFYDLDKYYESEHARPWYRFTRSAVVWLLGQKQPPRDDAANSRDRYSPDWNWRWDLWLGLPWAKSASDRNAPVLVVDRKDAQRFLAVADAGREEATR